MADHPTSSLARVLALVGVADGSFAALFFAGALAAEAVELRVGLGICAAALGIASAALFHVARMQTATAARISIRP